MIKKNIEEVLAGIEGAKKRSSYSKDVCLIAVSKTKPVSAIEEAYACGIRDFGENKVQELVDKYEQLPKDIRWHMIGHLQRNKVKYIVDKVYMIHSVDSLRLAEEISKDAIKKNVNVNILVEVNIAEEESKFGIHTKQECVELVKQIAKLPNIYIKGLMTVAPYTENAEEKYRVSDLNISFIQDKSLKIKAEYTIEIPVSFGDFDLVTAEVPITIKSKYTDKFS